MSVLALLGNAVFSARPVFSQTETRNAVHHEPQAEAGTNPVPASPDFPHTSPPGKYSQPIPPIQEFLPILPPRLTPEQMAAAGAILEEARPRLRALHRELTGTMEELRELSFSPDTPQDHLIQLGQRLVKNRDALREELQSISDRMTREIGINPGWGRTRGCNAWDIWADVPKTDPHK